MHISVFNNIFENIIQLYSFYPQQACMWDSLGELPVHKVKNLNILKYFMKVDRSLIPLKNILNGKQVIHYVAEKQLAPLIIHILDEFPSCWNSKDGNDKIWSDYTMEKTKAEVLKLVKAKPDMEQAN